MKLLVAWLFIYKNPDTSQKARQFALRFYIQTARHFVLRGFSLKKINLRRERSILLNKNYALYVTFYIKKTMHFALRFYVQKSRHFALHFYIQKMMHFALRFYI